MLREEKRFNTKHLKINITKENLKKGLLDLNPNKSSGPDRIHPKTFIETAAVISKQFGFIKKSLTALQLLNIMDEWTETPEMGEFVDVVYFDFPEAFNTVSHSN